MKSAWQQNKLRVAAPSAAPPAPRTTVPLGQGRVAWQLPTDGQLRERPLPQAPAPAQLCAGLCATPAVPGAAERIVRLRKQLSVGGRRAGLTDTERAGFSEGS